MKINRKVIKNRRAEMGLTQKKVAIAIGMSEAGYRNFESGGREISKNLTSELIELMELTYDEIYSDETYDKTELEIKGLKLLGINKEVAERLVECMGVVTEVNEDFIRRLKNLIEKEGA